MWFVRLYLLPAVMAVLQVISHSALNPYQQWFDYLSSPFLGLWQFPIFFLLECRQVVLGHLHLCTSAVNTLHFWKKNFYATSYFMASFMVFVYFSIATSFQSAASPLFLKQMSSVRKVRTKWQQLTEVFKVKAKYFLTYVPLADQFIVKSIPAFSFFRKQAFSFVL